MGRSNQQRRAEKKRKKQQRARRGPAGPGGAAGDRRGGGHTRDAGAAGSGDSAAGSSSASPPRLEDLARAAAATWEVDEARHEQLVAMLAARAEAAAPVVGELLAGAMAQLWESGWTPADMARVASRKLSQAHGDLAGELAVADGRARAARDEALHPPLGGAAGRGGRPHRVDRRARREPAARGRGAVGAAVAAARAAADRAAAGAGGGVGVAGRGAGRARAGAAARVAGQGRGHRVRRGGRGADGEGAGAHHPPRRRRGAGARRRRRRRAVGGRIPVDPPYAEPKAAVVGQVGEANRCRVVYDAHVDWVTVVGYEGDLDAVELLAASLLAQATAAMARHGSRRDAAGRSRTRSFRRSFVYGFADRIGQRLRETAEQQTAATAAGDDRLLPVLSARDERVEAAVAQAFPHMEQRAGSVSHGGGYTAGQAAADLADLDVSAGALREARAG